MVRWLRWHCPPDTRFEIRALAVWVRARYLSVTEAPTILTFTRGWGRNIFVSFKPPRPGTEPRILAWKAAVLTTTLGPPPIKLSNTMASYLNFHVLEVLSRCRDTHFKCETVFCLKNTDIISQRLHHQPVNVCSISLPTSAASACQRLQHQPANVCSISLPTSAASDCQRLQHQPNVCSISLPTSAASAYQRLKHQPANVRSISLTTSDNVCSISLPTSAASACQRLQH